MTWLRGVQLRWKWVFFFLSLFLGESNDSAMLNVIYLFLSFSDCRCISDEQEQKKRLRQKANERNTSTGLWITLIVQLGHVGLVSTKWWGLIWKRFRVSFSTMNTARKTQAIQSSVNETVFKPSVKCGARSAWMEQWWERSPPTNETVVDSRLFPRVFLRVLRFSFLHKTQHSKFQLDQDREPTWKPAKVDVVSSLNIVIYFKF